MTSNKNTMSHQFDRVLLHNDEGVPIAAIWATFGSGEIITRNEEVYKKAKSIRFGTREFQVNSFKTDGKKNQYLIFDVEEI